MLIAFAGSLYTQVDTRLKLYLSLPVIDIDSTSAHIIYN